MLIPLIEDVSVLRINEILLSGFNENTLKSRNYESYSMK